MMSKKKCKFKFQLNRRILHNGLTVLTLTVLAGVLSSCATGFPNGLIYTNVTLPISASAETEKIKDYNIGKSTCIKILGLWATGDASIEKAKANGSVGPITKIQRVEYHANDILGCGTFTTIVYGESESKK